MRNLTSTELDTLDRDPLLSALRNAMVLAMEREGDGADDGAEIPLIRRDLDAREAELLAALS